MRIHIQNSPGDALFAVSPQQWQEAASRAGESGHEVAFGASDADFATGVARADILIGATSTLAGRFPCHAPDLKMIFCMSAGVDRLRPFDALPAGAIVVNNSGVHGRKAGEYAAMALLMLNARLPAVLAAQRAQEWRPVYAPSLRGRRVTVIGTGDLGSAAGRAAAQFGAVVTGVRTRAVPHPDFHRVIAADALDSVLPESEFVVLACPLTEATRNLLDRRRLSLLPAGAAVVNIGRGALLDQEALCDLLDSGHVSGAVLDVFVPEPIPTGHRLWTTKNLVATPHVSVDDPLTYNPDSLDIFFRHLRAWRDGGEMPNLVDLGRGY
ncbi:D-2-hydroxyacid dehydrogenase [Limobrevibacterium gyesilva]|uniref:D-2-hydroxyacid dehydrogenase n=1 Tax=Limobrevibacterium gyesilva TaxID=2991712 RepID=A0AA41YNF1_9PROT|nr:D-2-hydroxyacid dehydrogenase [Limobrevibacterium gyesilva]MCW3473530.1 D-2-hydroxyacid dehydrogenase [Limobrevibacterium gyesilva]